MTSCNAGVVCCIEMVRSAVPRTSRRSRRFQPLKRLVDDCASSGRAACVADTHCATTDQPATAAGPANNVSSPQHEHWSPVTRHLSTTTRQSVVNSPATGVTGKMPNKIHLTTTDSSQKDRAMSSSVNVQTSSQRQARCNGRMMTSSSSLQNNSPPAGVKSPKKRKRTKSDGLCILLTCHDCRGR